MSISSPSQLHEFLNAIGARPQKRLSQNFLIDQNILRKIVEASQCKPGEKVLEIGAGPGALTEALMKAGCVVTAVEKDHLFAKHLERFSDLKIFAGDIRDFDLESMGQGGTAKVSANLPYNLTSPILGLLAPRSDLFSDLTLMVQDEVARRMTAKPSTEDYSALTLFVNFYANVSYAFKVSRRSFYPAPKVDSAIVRLELCKRHLRDVEGFFNTIKKAFQKRRKMLRSSLKEHFPLVNIEKTLSQIGLNSESRPENLSLEEWIAFHDTLTEKN
jgi:16S rRNA (adenine1518-N6/adenine1519-N6)-dimethyltransferase